MHSQGTVFKGSLLVAGTAIGGGMLALPVLTSLGGFLPSLLIYLVCWMFMVCTGLLILEVYLWMDREVNLVSMAEKTLGKKGKWAAWALYIFMFYCLTLAYMVGCGQLLMQWVAPSFSAAFGPLLFLCLFGPITYAGAKWVSKVNVGFMLALGVLYVAIVAMGWSEVKKENLLERHWVASLRALPVAFTAFAFQGIVPTLTSYLNRDPYKVRKAILIGSFIPFVTYIIWQWLIMGIVPLHGRGGLLEALENGQTAVEPLKAAIQNPYVYVVGQCFAFLALLTSFLGVTLALVDFLADGLSVEKTAKGRAFLCSLIFIPVLAFSMLHPHVFLEALDYAGGYGTALLLGMLPILMVWAGRYRGNHSSLLPLPGGRGFLLALGLFVIFEVLLETYFRLS